MEKEHTSSYDKTCGWCGLDKGFSWLRLILAIVIGLFIFFAGIEIGQLRVLNSQGNHQIRRQGWSTNMMTMPMGNDTNGAQAVPANGTTTTTLVSPAHPVNPTITVTPAQ